MRIGGQSRYRVFLAFLLIQSLTLQTVLTGCQSRAFTSEVKGDDLDINSVRSSTNMLFTNIATQEDLASRLKQVNCPTQPTPLDPAFLARELRYAAARLLLLGCLAFPFWAFSSSRDAFRQTDGLRMGIPSIENVSTRLDQLNQKTNLSPADAEEREALSRQLKEFNQRADGWPSFVAALIFVAAGAGSGLVLAISADSAKALSRSRNTGDTIRLIGEVWNRINAEALDRSKRKELEKGLGESTREVRKNVEELFDLIDGDPSYLVPIESSDSASNVWTRYVLAPSYIRADFVQGESAANVQKIKAAMSNWPQGLPRIEMNVGYNRLTDRVMGDLIFVHPGGQKSEPIFRAQVENMLEPTKENITHRRISSALQTASVRGALSDEGMKDLVFNWLPNTVQILLTQMALTRESGRANSALQRQLAQAAQLPAGMGMPVRLTNDGGVALGEEVPLPHSANPVE